jgi:hypothetical protein
MSKVNHIIRMSTGYEKLIQNMSYPSQAAVEQWLKNNEAQLQNVKGLYSWVINQMPGGSYVIRAHSTTCNSKFTDATGKTPRLALINLLMNNCWEMNPWS